MQLEREFQAKEYEELKKQLKELENKQILLIKIEEKKKEIIEK